MLKVKSLAGALSLLFLLTFIHPCNGNTGGETVVVFQDGKTEVQYLVKDGQTATKTPIAFNAPSFVGGMINNKEFLAIISSGRVADSHQGDYTDVVVRTSHGDHKQWSAAEGSTTVLEQKDPVTSWGDTTAVMKGNKIYVLITSMGNPNSANELREPSMIVGTVTNRTERNIREVYIQWGEATNVKDKLPQSLQDAGGSKFMGGEGNGIVTTKGTIMFPIVIKKDVDKVASTLYSTDDGQTWHIGEETETDSSDGSLVEWSDEKLLFIAVSIQVPWKVFESNDFGITWKRSPIFFEVWGNGENHLGRETPGSVITVPVDNKNVLLFAFPQNKVESNDDFDTLQLWLSDGRRIMCIGTISDDSKETNTGHSVLAYVGENLYVTHQINPRGDENRETTHKDKNWKNVIGLTPLPDFLENVKTTVLAWRKLDDRYKKKGIPTDALVGFLGNTKTDNEKVWADMYNCVSATVNGGKIVDGGFQFNGAADSGAKWPVSSQGQNQVYKFTENQFTLAATVIIHSTKGDGDVSLLGAIGGAEGKDILIGLGYTKEMKWYLKHKSAEKIDTKLPFVFEEEYNVAITLDNKKVSVFVDDVEIAKGTITLTEALSISHFFIGGTGESPAATTDNLCTVKNVMLFSRVLTKDEVTQLTNVKDINKIEAETTEANKRSLRQTPAENSRMTPSRDTNGHVLTPDTEPTIAQGNDKTISATGSTSTTENIKSMPTMKPKEASVITPNKTTNKRDQDKKINNALHGKGDAVLKRDTKGDNGAAVSLSAVAWMCFVCSLIALMGF